MEMLLALIHKEMNAGFDRVTSRLDRINGTVQEQGKQIAVLETAMDLNATAVQQTAQDLSQMATDFIDHRARCPFDKNGNPTENARDYVKLPRSHVMAAGSLGAIIATTLIEMLPRLFARLAP